MTDNLDDLFGNQAAEDALAAFKSTDPDWHRKWSLIFTLLGSRAGQLTDDLQPEPVELNPKLGQMLFLVADMIRDLESGARHPLAQPKKITNRPPLNSPQVHRLILLASVAGIELAKGRNMARETEVSYREAARSIRKVGIEISWKELRSAWNNRKRQGIEELVTATMQPVIDRNFDPDALSVLLHLVKSLINQRGGSSD